MRPDFDPQAELKDMVMEMPGFLWENSVVSFKNKSLLHSFDKIWNKIKHNRLFDLFSKLIRALIILVLALLVALATLRFCFSAYGIVERIMFSRHAEL